MLQQYQQCLEHVPSIRVTAREHQFLGNERISAVLSACSHGRSHIVVLARFIQQLKNNLGVVSLRMRVQEHTYIQPKTGSGSRPITITSSKSEKFREQIECSSAALQIY